MRWFVIVLLITVRVATARADATCNEDRSLCCDWWTVDVANGGSILERTYQQLQEAIERGRSVGDKLCRYFGPEDSSCKKGVGQPRCMESRSCSASTTWDVWTKALEREATNASTWRPPWDELAGGVTDALGIARDPEHNPFANVGTVVFSYGWTVGEVLGQVRRARELLTASTGTGLRFLSGYGVFGEVDEQMVDLWNQNGGFAGAAELDEVACEAKAIEINVARVQSLGRAVARLPIPPRMEMPTRGVGTVQRTSTVGAIVVGGWRKGQRISGKPPIAWVSRTGAHAFDVRVTTTVGPQGESIVRLIGGPSGDEAEIVFRGDAPDRDGDRIADVHDRCPDALGPAPTGCPPPCPSRSRWDGSICRCDVGTDVVHGACVPQYVRCGEDVPPSRIARAQEWPNFSCGGGACTTKDQISDELDRRCRGEFPGERLPALGSRCIVLGPSVVKVPAGAQPLELVPTVSRAWCIP